MTPQREQFKAWAKAHGLLLGRLKCLPDVYADDDTAVAWIAWQAAQAAMPAANPSYEALVGFAVDEQFLLFCDEDEFIQIARAVLNKFAAAAAGAVRQEATECCRQRPCLRPGKGPCDLPADAKEAP